MGGNAFPRLPMGRVKREHVLPTLQYVVHTLNVPGFTLDYARENLMGSAGKQDSSGDLDFALNNRQARFVGEPELPLFDLKAMAARTRAVLPEGHVDTRTLRGGQFQSAWPVAGDASLGLVQVDFLAGDPEWLRFSHWSPGKDVSPWKGVFNSTLMGVLAKHLKEFELFDPERPEERVARVGWHFDLEKGLHRKWKMRRRVGQGLSVVDADTLETRFPDCPRLNRVGYLTNPTVVLSVLFGGHTEHHEVDTFEKMLQRTKLVYSDVYEDLVDRTVEALLRSAARSEYTEEEMRRAF